MPSAVCSTIINRPRTGSVTSITPVDKKTFANWRKRAPKAQVAWAASLGFTAGAGTVLCLPGSDGAIKGALWGLGEEGAKLPRDPWDYGGLASALPAGRYELSGRMSAETATNAALGWALEQYNFDRYKASDGAQARKLVLPKGATRKRVNALLDAISLVRDLINTPAEDMGPTALAKATRAMAKKHGAKISVVTGKALESGFPAIHAVGRAATDAPRLIDMRWGRPNDPKITLVGKGVCFDSGGLDIKPAAGMRLMKKDMGGAANVLGLASAIMALGLKIRLRVLIPAVENAIAGNAYRPGDIVQTRKGLSVEIGNTDAEGRVVLADALTLADEENPELLFDFATLTGAARVALGPDLPALFSNDDKLAAGLAAEGADIGDPVWHMPLWQPYMEGLKSPIADLNNMADSPFGGSITAALFLSCFVGASARWAHLDVMAWNGKPRPGRPVGGEAMGLRAALAYLERQYK